MKSRGTHEDCIQQLYRLLTTRLFSDGENYDIEGRYRVDHYELDHQVQKSVSDAWGNISDESLALLADFDEYKRSFLRLFGFEIAGIDYSRDVDPEKVIPGIINL